MKRPSFQFYPADWQANSNLRRCTHEEKGIWMDVLCLLHDQDTYGMVNWSLKEIAQAIGCTVKKLQGLAEKGILKGADPGVACEALQFSPRHGRETGPTVTLIEAQNGPLWYSSRMVIDEYKRIQRGGFGDVSKPSPKGGIGTAPKDSPNTSPSRACASSPSTSPSTFQTTTTTTRATLAVDNSGAIAMTAGWIPSDECIQACITQGVTAVFLDEYLPRWRLYWTERREKRSTWNSIFLEQCVKEFNKELGIPIAATR